VVKRAEEYQRLATIEENLGYTLKALETGGVDDGVKYDSYREMAAVRAAGDTRQAERRTRYLRHPIHFGG
jgi:hypothetical protein